MALHGPVGLISRTRGPSTLGAVRGFLLINPKAGEERPSADELRAAAAERGIETHVLRRGDDPAELARNADTAALGVAGGDGSLAAIAAVALERAIPFVCIPFGTRNHFARDLGLDRDDPFAALSAFEGRERRVDVGRVGDQVFLNNVSLGIYADLVHRRERHGARRQTLAGARALWRTIRGRRALRVAINGRTVSARVVLVANNSYELDLFNVGERTALDEGRLYVYAARGWLPGTWDERSGERFTLDPGSALAAVAVDGEPLELEAPLEFTIESQALRVLVPQAPG